MDTRQPQTTSLNGNELERLIHDLSAVILPWAKQNHPEKYAQTIQMVNYPPTMLKYLVRLLEIRWETEKAIRSEIPCSLLEHTSIVARLRDRKTGEIIEVKGRNATGGRVWAFKELQTLDRDSFDELSALKRTLDLELVPT